MEMQFQKNAISYLQTLLRQQQKQEQTQQIRLTDAMPDIGRVLGCWGQIMIRGKEWHSGSVGLSGGIMAWVLYQPEDEGNPCCVDTWIPFQMKWDTDVMERDGIMEVCTSLCHIDARMLSDRKLIVRANICAQMHAMVDADAMLYVPLELPDDIQVLQRTYPMRLPAEAGEKQFDIEQQLDIPPDGARIHKLIYYSALPTLTEYKIVADKLVLRGNVAIYALYMDEFGKIHRGAWKVPFSQYTQLEDEYAPESEVDVCFALTQLEMEVIQPDALNLKLGFTAQYVVSAIQNITVTEDIYSPVRNVKEKAEPLNLPSILQSKNQVIKVEVTAPEGNILDASLQLEPHQIQRDADRVETVLEGVLQTLYEDDEGKIQCTSERWQKTINTVAAESAVYQVAVEQVRSADQEKEMGMELRLAEKIIAMEPIQMVMGVEVGEMITPDPLRPSLILCRSGSDSLWNIAKSTGSTVELIRKANGLQGELTEDQMLLIPIN